MIEKFKGKLIVFEGPADHCGKSTLARALNEKLLLEGMDVLLTKQPGDVPGELSELFQSLCKDKKWNLHPMSNLFAFLLDRSEHTSKIVLPALQSGKTVICDRWFYSTIAYQFYGKQLLEKFNLNEEFAYWMNSIASLGCDPDVVFYIERNQAKVEAEKDTETDQFETASREFKERVRVAYEKMASTIPIFRRIPVIESDIQGTLSQILETNF
jgi:dTMP kinase